MVPVVHKIQYIKMPPIVSKLKGKNCTRRHEQYFLMETEARNKKPSIPIEKAQLRTAKAIRVPRSTAQEI
jgi:hypothetical protein